MSRGDYFLSPQDTENETQFMDPVSGRFTPAYHKEGGITIREYAAIQIMAGISGGVMRLEINGVPVGHEVAAVRFADLLLAELEKK